MPDTRKVLVAGATGYIGRLLALELAAPGDDVRAWLATRRRPATSPAPAARSSRRRPRADTLAAALDGRRGRLLPGPLDGARGRTATSPPATARAAQNFAARGRRRPGSKQIVYLGGLAEGGSKHLASRHETAEVLGASGVPVTYFRAAAVIGAGSESFRTVLYLVQAPAGDGHAEAGPRPRPSRSRSPTSSPTWRDGARGRGGARPRDRDRRPRRHDLRRDDGRDGARRSASPPAPADRRCRVLTPAAVVACGSGWSPRSTPASPAR